MNINMRLGKASSVLASVMVAGALAATSAKADLAHLDGVWESLSCEVRPQVGQDGKVTEWWLTRKIEMRNGRISAEFTTYAGPGCDFALQRLDFAGSVTKAGDSDVIAGAVAADLKIDEYIRFTPLAEGFADFFNSAPAGTCGSGPWKVGETQDVHETGCSVIWSWRSRGLMDTFSLMKECVFHAGNKEPVPDGI